MSENKNTTVSCSGAESSKHPRVYLLIQEGEITICPYCSKEFKNEEHKSEKGSK